MAYKSVCFVLCMTGKVQFMATKTFVPKQFMTCIVILNKTAFGTNQQFLRPLQWLKWLWDDCQSYRSQDKKQNQIQFETLNSQKYGQVLSGKIFDSNSISLTSLISQSLPFAIMVLSLEHWIALEHVHFFVHGCHWLMQQWWFHDMSEIRSCYLSNGYGIAI